MKRTYAKHMVVFAGQPLCTPEELGYVSVDLFTDERYLPNIMVSLGVFPSKGQLRKNRPDLDLTLTGYGIEEYKVGKRIVEIIWGFPDEA